MKVGYTSDMFGDSTIKVEILLEGKDGRFAVQPVRKMVNIFGKNYVTHSGGIRIVSEINNIHEEKI